MQYRRLGKTDLMVSEIGLGGEWLERHNAQEVSDVIKACEQNGINILDCWMAEPNVRTNIGNAIKGHRENWYIQGHIGATWQNGQYVRTRDLAKVKPAFEDLLARMQTDYIDLGMIHYIDEVSDWEACMNGDYIKYVFELKEKGIIRHIGISTHNPVIGRLAAECGFIEMILFSVNPTFDMLPASEDNAFYFRERYEGEYHGIDPERADFYKLCEEHDVGITVMKPYAGGRLFDEKRSPLGVALTPVQCIHYCLTRPAVGSVLVGYDTVEHVKAAVAYETATDEEKDYATVLASAPLHAYSGQCTYCGHCKPCPVDIDIAMVNKLYDLAAMQADVPASIREHYKALSVPASACLSCGACESRCPFGVKITERMARAAELLG